MSMLFDTSGFTASQLTVRANDAVKFPFIETLARRLFNFDTIRGHVAQLDRESVGVRLMGTVAAGATAAASGTTRDRITVPVNAIKIGDRLTITPVQIDGVRMTGLQAGEVVALESMNNLVDKGLREKFSDMDHTMEWLCMHAIKGSFRNPGTGAEIINYADLFDVDAPEVISLNLDDTTAALGSLRAIYHAALNTIRFGLGNVVPTGYAAFYGSNAWMLVQAHPEMRDAFQRKDDGSFLSSSPFDAIRFAGIDHVEYRGPALGADEIVIVPLGVPGMLEVRYASGDKLGFTNEEGLPRFVVPKNQDDPFQDFGEGAEWEVSSRPVVYNLFPEAVVRATATAPVVIEG